MDPFNLDSIFMVFFYNFFWGVSPPPVVILLARWCWIVYLGGLKVGIRFIWFGRWVDLCANILNYL